MICIIPQHGGSVRLPGKAIRPFCGRSLIEFAVAQSMAAKCIDDVYVSTESEVVANLCEPLGAKIIWRPPEIQDKKFSANVPLFHAMDVIGEAATKGPLMPRLASSPLVKPGDIDRLYEVYMRAPDPPPGVCKAVQLGAETQEVVFYRQAPSRAGIKRAFPGLIDKTHRTLSTVGGISVIDAEGYVAANERVAWAFATERTRDTDIKDGLDNHEWFMLGVACGGGPTYYADCELWQTAEVDDAESFKLCEALMEHFILKGRTLEEVYVRHDT